VSAGTLNWWQIIALLGAAQGVILAMALIARRPRRTPNLLLAAALCAFSLHLASVTYYSAGWVVRWPHFFGITSALPLLFGPLLYLYAATASDRDRRLRRGELLHGLPFVAATVAGIPILRLSAEAKVALYAEIQQGNIPVVALVTDQLKLVSGVCYAVATLLLLHRHRRVIAENYSSLERVNLMWLQWLALGGAAIWLLAVGFTLVERVGGWSPLQGDQLIALSMTVMVYGIGYWGLRQPEIFRFATAEYPVPAPTTANAAVDANPTPRYGRSGLTPREADELQVRLVALMERDRPYRQPELTLGQLAERLGTTPHRLSEVLNAQLALSFYDFVNGYRVREVQERLSGPDGAQFTYLALALEAGFASKSTFNAAFKKLTGVTPSEYRRASGA
jgi:AraC-like DNA-binding protein